MDQSSDLSQARRGLDQCMHILARGHVHCRDGHLVPAYSDEAGHAFQYEAGHPFRDEAGHRSDLKPARWRSPCGSAG